MLIRRRTFYLLLAFGVVASMASGDSTLRAPIQRAAAPAEIRKIAMDWIFADEPARAVPVLEELTRVDPKDAAAHALLGEAHYALGDFDSAIVAFEKSIALDPKLRPRAFNLARSYELTRAFDQAEAIYQLMISDAEPAWAAKAHFGLGLVHEGRSNDDLARAAFRKAVEIDPKQHRAIYKLALVDLKNAALDSAVEQFQRVLELRPQHHGAAYNLSLALKRLGKDAESAAARERWQRIRDGKQRVATLRAQLRQTPNDAAIIGALAKQHLEMGDVQEAYRAYQEALRLQPREPELLLGLASTLTAAGRVSDAEGIYRALLRQQPPVRGALEPLVTLLRQRGANDEADSIVAEAEKVTPREP
ncbi:MAG: tetratricopeptide repeat protein [Planctomycetota bacterium]